MTTLVERHAAVADEISMKDNRNSTNDDMQEEVDEGERSLIHSCPVRCFFFLFNITMAFFSFSVFFCHSSAKFISS